MNKRTARQGLFSLLVIFLILINLRPTVSGGQFRLPSFERLCCAMSNINREITSFLVGQLRDGALQQRIDQDIHDANNLFVSVLNEVFRTDCYRNRLTDAQRWEIDTKLEYAGLWWLNNGSWNISGPFGPPNQDNSYPEFIKQMIHEVINNDLIDKKQALERELQRDPNFYCTPEGVTALRNNLQDLQNQLARLTEALDNLERTIQQVRQAKEEAKALLAQWCPAGTPTGTPTPTPTPQPTSTSTSFSISFTALYQTIDNFVAEFQETNCTNPNTGTLSQ